MIRFETVNELALKVTCQGGGVSDKSRRAAFIVELDKQLADSGARPEVIENVIYDAFNALADLQLEFMEQHEQLAPDVFRTAFSNGAEIISNYSSAAYAYKGKSVESMGYLLLR